MSTSLREVVGNLVVRPRALLRQRGSRRLRLEPLERRLVLAAPVAVDDAFVAFQAETLDVPAAAGVLANDSDADGDAMWAELLTGPARGTLDLQPDGSFTYDADAGYLGPDTFTYKALSEPQSAELLFIVDESASSVTIDATVTPSGLSSKSDSDSTSLRGTMTATITPPQSPFDVVHVTDIDVVAVDSMELRFNYIFVADLTVKTRPADDPEALRVQMETPGPAAVVVDDLFTQVNNDLRVTGTADLLCSGLACGGIPDTLDLDNVAENVDFTDAQILQSGGVITLTVPLEIYQRDVDDDGNVVEMWITGTIVSRADAPAVGIEESAPATVTIDVQPEERVVAGDDIYRLAEDTPISVSAAAPALEELIVPAGSIWRYLDDGSDQTALWQAADFDDGTWAQGPAQLGYSTGAVPEGDEATVVGFGGDEANKFITTYFRREFSLFDPAGVERLNVGLLRDDAAAVYLNGVEIVRDANLAAGATFDTPATPPTSGADESTFFPYSIDPATLPPGTLAEGRNVLAVEVHQSGPTSSDLSFDFTLSTVRYVGGVLQDDVHLLGGSTEAFLLTDPADGQLLFQSDGSFDYTPDPEFSGTDSFDYVAAEAGTMLVAPGATWRFLDDGSDQQTAWRDFGFDDGTWSAGPAELGYGDGDERTPLGYGPDAGDKYITTYFRYSFDVADASTFGPLMAYVIRDDGVAVYLNGTEIGRDNLIAGALFDTLADSPISGAAAERMPVLFAVPAGILRDGRNDLAVEIHQASGTSSDISFEMWMAAAPVSDVATAVLRVEPQDDAPIAQDDGTYQAMVGSSISVTAAEGLLANDTDVESDVFEAVVATPPTRGNVSVNPDGSFVYTATVDGPDSFTYRAVEPAAPLVDFGAAWRYLDDGSDQDVAWRQPGYDDGAWAVGGGQLGYGDGDEATVLRYGPDAADKHITTYFRRDFFVEDASRTSEVTLELIRDDGAAVYLNGVEIVRDNLAAGAAFDTPASAGAGGGDGEPPLTFTVPANRLVDGVNVLAVEVHQVSGGSGDVSFDARLAGRLGSDPATVRLENEVAPAEVVGRFVFYHDSEFEAEGGIAAAIATDKTPLLPGGTATFENVTSYDHGINGIVIDIQDLPLAVRITAFQFEVSDTNEPDGWSTVDYQTAGLTRGAGVDGSDRVAVTFSDDAIENRWLRVTVQAGPMTGLGADDVFYFGNAIGEAKVASRTALVNAADVIAIRDNPRGVANPASIDNPYDINRDMLVNAVDLILARNNAVGPLAALPLMAPVAPPAEPGVSGEGAPESGKRKAESGGVIAGTQLRFDADRDDVASRLLADTRWWDKIGGE